MDATTHDDLLSHLSEKIERVSVQYAHTHDIERTPDWFLLKLHEELGELTQAYLQYHGRARKKGLTDEQLRKKLEEETADVFCHIMLIARHNSVDLPDALFNKWFCFLEQ